MQPVAVPRCHLKEITSWISLHVFDDARFSAIANVHEHSPTAWRACFIIAKSCVAPLEPHTRTKVGLKAADLALGIAKVLQKDNPYQSEISFPGLIVAPRFNGYRVRNNVNMSSLPIEWLRS